MTVIEFCKFKTTVKKNKIKVKSWNIKNNKIIKNYEDYKKL